MFKIIAIIIVLAIAAILIYAATLPDTFRMERSTVIKTSPEKVSAKLTDFKQWASWSPWENRDPEMKRTYSGAATGQGSVYDWTGNNKVGTGRMEISDVQPNKVSIKLDFLKPFEAHNMAEFVLEPQGESTKVTWSMFGPMRYINKVMNTVASMDKMVGPDFEEGLAKLKVAAEK
jgi:uncharacterized protein YndB with AHSA1/START domain